MYPSRLLRRLVPVLALAALLLMLAACRVSAEADAQAEEAFQRMMERRSRNGKAVLHKEAVMDAGKE